MGLREAVHHLFLITLAVITFLIIPVFSIASDDLATGSSLEEMVSEPVENTKLSLEAFEALSTEDKKNIYYTQPEQLPDDFQSIEYWDTIHSVDETDLFSE